MAGRPDWAAFSRHVGGPEELADALRARDGDPFEHAVAALLFLLGFATAHFGANTFRRGGDMPDMIAFAMMENWLLVVECTTRELDLPAKIAKLVTRTKEIQDVLGPYIAYPLLVTRQSRAEISKTALGDAARENVGLVTSDNFDDLVRFATEGQPIERIKDYLAKLIPSTL